MGKMFPCFVEHEEPVANVDNDPASQNSSADVPNLTKSKS